MKQIVILLLLPVIFSCKKSTELIENDQVPTIISFTPSTAGRGAIVAITGSNFNGATAVSFGGTAAVAFTVVSSTSINAVIGSGSSGSVSVTSAGGTTALAGFTYNAEPALKLSVDFNAGNYAPLTYTSGRTDSPADADPAYNALTSGNQIVYNIPNSTLRPKLSGFLDLPQSIGYAPISGNMIHEFTFTNVAQLNSLGADAGSLAIAGCYIRGNYSSTNGKDWTTGDNFGGYWFGFIKNADGTRQTVIRSTNTNLISENFTATTSVSYRIYKKGNTIELFRKYDGAADWTKVGETTLSIRTGGSSDVYITHVRVLNNSNAAVAVNADDFKWYY